MGSTGISGTGVTDPYEFQRHCHCTNLNRRPVADFIIIRAVLFDKDNFLLSYSYGFRRTSMNEVLETLSRVFKYGFVAWVAQTMKSMSKKSMDFSFMKTSKKDQTEEEDNSEDNMETLKIQITDKSDAISAAYSPAVHVEVFNLNDYHQADLSVRTGRIENLYILPRDASLTEVTSILASSDKHGLHYSRCTLSVIFHAGVSSRDVTTHSTGVLTAGIHILINCMKMILPDRCRHLESLRQFHGKGDL